MILLALSLPPWAMFQLFRATTAHADSLPLRLSIHIGWLYLPAVVLGFVRVIRRRSPEEGRPVEVLLPPSLVILILSLLSLLE